jgi:hypothetical protein
MLMRCDALSDMARGIASDADNSRLCLIEIISAVGTETEETANPL